MVFIFLGAVKAAKTAKLEYDKDKKRTAMIVPCEGSHDMIADRRDAAAASSSSSSLPATSTAGGGGADTWWGTARPKSSVEHPLANHVRSHSAIGCWSREQQKQPSQDPDNVYISSSTASPPARPISQSSASDTSSHLVALPAPSPPPEPSRETQSPSSNPQQPTRKLPQLPAPHALFDPAVPRHPQNPPPASASAPSTDISPAPPRADNLPHDGSFAAAMRAPMRKPSRTRPPERPRPPTEAAVSDGALASAIPATPLRKPSRARSTARPSVSVPVKAKVQETDGSFAAAMRKESCRGACGKEADAGSAVMKRQASALAYPAGSKAKARPPARSAQTEKAEPDAAAAASSVTGEAQSSLRKEGSMKRRVSRR